MAARLGVWVAQTALLPMQGIYGGPGTSWDWLARFSGSAAAAGAMGNGGPVHLVELICRDWYSVDLDTSSDLHEAACVQVGSDIRAMVTLTSSKM